MKKAKKYLSSVLMLYVVLGTWKGHIALYQGDSREPARIFPNLAVSLPPEDQAALEEGIVIRNDRDLNRLLEDYLS